jgi:thioredoxin reductase (NADPH)
MDYSVIPTTVFTPLELGTVGLTENQAIEMYGKDRIDCYLSSFRPLEWTFDQNFLRPKEVLCTSKVVILKSSDNKIDNEQVLGIHIACPNAGEIIQGFAVALRKGLSYKVSHWKRSFSLVMGIIS